MKIICETSIENFEAWSGGKDTLNTLIEKGLCDSLEHHIENDIFPDGCTDTQLNDFLWFENDFIAELLGYRNWEDLENDEEEEEEEEEINKELATEELKEAEKTGDFKTFCECFSNCEHCPYNDRAKTVEECEVLWNEEH